LDGINAILADGGQIAPQSRNAGSITPKQNFPSTMFVLLLAPTLQKIKVLMKMLVVLLII
jgi:hypothetical protein